jgi:transposase
MKKEKVLEAIRGSGAIMSTIAKRLDVAWHTADKYCHKTEETKQALENEIERTLDLAESVLLESIKSGNTQDAKWYLSTKGKTRGFNEKYEIAHSGNIEINIGDEWENV